jgi:hypothetical protein
MVQRFATRKCVGCALHEHEEELITTWLLRGSGKTQYSNYCMQYCFELHRADCAVELNENRRHNDDFR